MNYFAGNLQFALLKFGLKQNQLSTQLEEKYQVIVSASQISNYVKGKSYCTMEVAFALSDFFGISLDDFFRRDIREKPPNGKAKLGPPLSMTIDEGVAYEKASREAAAVAVATESPPPEEREETKDEIKKMKQEMLQMMMKLETLDV
jgi:transcriptional regulator with XRE-family HTH domain